MKLKKMVSVFLLLVMVMASSFSAFASEEEVFEYDGIKFTVAGRVTIGEKERGSTNLTLGEGLLMEKNITLRRRQSVMIHWEIIQPPQ